MLKQSNTISLNGVDYEVDTESQAQVHMINQIASIEQKMNKLKLEVEELSMAHQGYGIKLEEMLKADKEKPVEEEKFEDTE